MYCNLFMFNWKREKVKSKPRVLIELVETAQSGDKASLEELIESVKNEVYNFALRMLWHPQDAEDATQEILIKVITNLGSFEGKSRFTTWIYSIAANHLSTTRKREAEKQEISFELFRNDLQSGFTDQKNLQMPDAERELLVQEVKIGCTHAILLCLDRSHRVAFILNTIFGVSGKEGAEILGVTSEAFRKRTSRARNEVKKFMEPLCGLIDSANQCHCERRIEIAIKNKRFDPQHPFFIYQPRADKSQGVFQHYLSEMEELDRSAIVLKSNPYFRSPDYPVEQVRSIIHSTEFKMLQEHPETMTDINKQGSK